MQILITGGTGFIGRACIEFFSGKGHHIIVLTRKQGLQLKNAKTISNIEEIKTSEKVDVIINLAGASINKRWTKNYKEEIVNSRLAVTHDVVSLIEKLETKPQLLISASAVGYYGCQQNNLLDEDSLYVEGFTHDLCQKWEDEALRAKNFGVRLCIARLGVVLSKNGGIMAKLKPIFLKGFGAKLGTGQQYFSWIHIFDLVNAFYFLIEKAECEGAYNFTAPAPVTNAAFTKAVNDVIHLPTLLTLPSPVIKVLLGEMGDTLLLKGQNVVPKRLVDAGFKFRYGKINDAVNKVVGEGN
jgi:uncharacterized protein (TIGR01777 family)